jgi:hypothetical protein
VIVTLREVWDREKKNMEKKGKTRLEKIAEMKKFGIIRIFLAPTRLISYNKFQNASTGREGMYFGTECKSYTPILSFGK